MWIEVDRWAFPLALSLSLPHSLFSLLISLSLVAATKLIRTQKRISLQKRGMAGSASTRGGAHSEAEEQEQRIH